MGGFANEKEDHGQRAERRCHCAGTGCSRLRRAIENAANGWAMLGYTLLAIVLGCAALALAGLGLVAEQRKEPQKIHKVPENTVKKAVCGRKVG